MATQPDPTSSPISASSSPLQPLGDGPDGEDVGRAIAPRPVEDEVRDRLVVVDRGRVRHAADAGEAAPDRRAGPRPDRLDVLPARLPQMHVQVHEPRTDHLAPSVQHPVRRRARSARTRRRERRDPSILDEQILHRVPPARRIDDPPAFNQDSHAPLRSTLRFGTLNRLLVSPEYCPISPGRPPRRHSRARGNPEKNPLSGRLLNTVQLSLDFARDREPVERQGGTRKVEWSEHPAAGWVQAYRRYAFSAAC